MASEAGRPWGWFDPEVLDQLSPARAPEIGRLRQFQHSRTGTRQSIPEKLRSDAR